MFPGGVHDLDDVPVHLGVNVYLAHGALAGENILGGGDGFEGFDGMHHLEALKHGNFVFQLRVAQAQAHEEAIQLCLGQGEGAFVVDGILGGDQKEGREKLVIIAIGGDFAFRHGFEEGGLGARGGAVNFVSQDDLGKDGAGPEFKLGGLGIENAVAGNVVGQQVGGTLDAFEGAADAAGDGAGEHGLGHTGDVFKQNMAFGTIGHHGEDDLVALADDHLFDVVHDAVDGGGHGRLHGLAFGGGLEFGDANGLVTSA